MPFSISGITDLKFFFDNSLYYFLKLFTANKFIIENYFSFFSFIKWNFKIKVSKLLSFELFPIKFPLILYLLKQQKDTLLKIKNIQREIQEELASFILSCK